MDEQQLKTVAQIIGKIAYKSHPNDRDDMEQELWIEAIRAARNFRAELGVPFVKYMAALLGMRRVDVLRRTSARMRGGRIRYCRNTFSDMFADPEQRNALFEQTVDPLSCDGVEATDWADLGERIKGEAVEVQAVYLYASGLRMKDIGEMFGFSESRVSQLRSNQYKPAAIERIKFLIFEKRRKATAKSKEPLPMNPLIPQVSTPAAQNGPVDPIDALVQLVQCGDSKTLAAIAAKIKEHKAAIVSLQKLEKVLLAGVPRTTTARRSSGSGMLREQLHDMITANGPTSVGQAALHFGCKPQSIRMAITKSGGMLRVKGDLIQI